MGLLLVASLTVFFATNQPINIVFGLIETLHLLRLRSLHRGVNRKRTFMSTRLWCMERLVVNQIFQVVVSKRQHLQFGLKRQV
jgi:hypothetical protein